ncbi:MAG: hypothetical protein QOG62_1910 [Thermoleophilaceae bacterium]|nr:hypothetical protein [Thermoleophilaceae bacterium]
MRRVIATIGLLGAVALIFFGLGSGGSSGGYEIRAVFDNGGFLVPGEDVRIAGAKVGSVTSVGVTLATDEVHRSGAPQPGKAVVVMDIQDAGFQDFRSDASCIIRPASLLGEKYVDCNPTQQRAPGTPPPPPLDVVPSDQPGAGQYFLPLENNGKEVDIDLVNNIMREPFADRFRLILNDLGAGLAARGKDLQGIVRRADPALRETDQVLAQLARQSHVLNKLAVDSDRALAPLARERQHVAGFINNANTAGQATAERSAALEAGFQKFPPALHALRLQMVQLQRFADQARPTFADFAEAAPNITRSTKALGPFAHAATPALTSLGDAAAKSAQPIVNSDPILVKIRNLAEKARPGAKSLSELLTSLRQSGGNKKLMSLLFNATGSINGFDKFGHFLRATLVINPCTTLVSSVAPGCAANWGAQSALTKLAAASGQTPSDYTASHAATPPSGGGVPFDALGDLAGGSASSSTGSSSRPKPSATPAIPSLNDARDLLDTLMGPPTDYGSQQPAPYDSTPGQGAGP